MTRNNLERMTVPNLLQRFATIGLDQDKALLRGEHKKFNRLFDEMVAIEEELKMREGDQRRELLDLYDPEPPRVCRRPFDLSHAAMAGLSSME